MAGLREYRAKRDFSKTAEPAGLSPPAKAQSGGLFVMHKHAATRLHYDLRLEHDGVLWSWAVTRGPSLDPAEKRLAVHVEDHPLDYGSFEGNIPKGEYGGGAVVLWDEGTWTPEFDPVKGMKKGHIRFALDGQKLKGEWHLVKLKPRRGEKRDNWLLIKSDDEYADPGRDILEELPHSVKTGRTIEEVAENKPPGKKRAARPASKASAKSGKTRLPGFIPPCLARLETKPPSGEEWVHEVKFDGYRLQAHIAQGEVRLYTRTGLDWTGKFGAPIANALAALDCVSAVVDGEVVVLQENGVSNFSSLQLALSEGRHGDMIFYAFDLLHLDGKTLLDRPLLQRKQAFRDLLGDGAAGHLRYSEHFTAPGQQMLDNACDLGLEGIVSKRADAPYRSGRAYDWIKSKCALRQEFVIAGYLPSDKTGRGIRSLIMSYYENGKLTPAGNVGTGFTAETLRDLKRTLDPLQRKSPPLSGPLARQKGAVWLEPEVVAEVEFRTWTHDGLIRQASYQGLREDKPAKEVVPETKPGYVAPVKAEAARAAAKGKTRMPKTTVKLSNPTKKLWPDEGVTKRDLLDYYAGVWPRMKQFVVERPLSLVRAPDGIGGQRFFQKHSMPGMPDKIFKSNDPEDGEEVLFIRDFDGLAALVQLGVVEVHIWGSKIETIGQPDQIVFDLDPDEGLNVEDVRSATLDIRARLEELGFATFVKTSGGKGFHVVVPLEERADWDEVKTFAHDFSRALAQTQPERYTATLSKKARTGRIFIDYLRNGRGSTAIAPWSSRAKKGATVAVPVTWEMVEGGVGPADYRVGEAQIAERLAAPDPWADFFKRAKPLERR
jgi:bifunctional non-homologous end joining protein LigD